MTVMCEFLPWSLLNYRLNSWCILILNAFYCLQCVCVCVRVRMKSSHFHQRLVLINKLSEKPSIILLSSTHRFPLMSASQTSKSRV